MPEFARYDDDDDAMLSGEGLVSCTQEWLDVVFVQTVCYKHCYYNVVKQVSCDLRACVKRRIPLSRKPVA